MKQLDMYGMHVNRHFNGTLDVGFVKIDGESGDYYNAEITWTKSEPPGNPVPAIRMRDSMTPTTHNPASVFLEQLKVSLEQLNMLQGQDKIKYLEGELEATKRHLSDLRKIMFEVDKEIMQQ